MVKIKSGRQRVNLHLNQNIFGEALGQFDVSVQVVLRYTGASFAVAAPPFS